MWQVIFFQMFLLQTSCASMPYYHWKLVFAYVCFQLSCCRSFLASYDYCRPFLGIHSLSYAGFLLRVIFFWIFGKVLNLFEQKTCFVMLPPTHFLILYYFNNFPETVLDINCFPLIPFSFHAPFNSSVKTFAKSSLRWMLFAIFLGVKPSSLISVEVRFLDAMTCFPVAKLTDSSVLAFLVLVNSADIV